MVMTMVPMMVLMMDLMLVMVMVTVALAMVMASALEKGDGEGVEKGQAGLVNGMGLLRAREQQDVGAPIAVAESVGVVLAWEIWLCWLDSVGRGWCGRR